MREKAEKPAKRKLTRAERKQIEAVIRQAKGDGKNHTVQDSIPFQNMFPDGLCRLEGGTFSKTIAFEDVNYRLAGPEDQRSIFESLCDFYNGYDPSIGVQVSLDSRSGGSAADEMFGITPQGNDLDPIRDEAVDILRMQYKRGNNGYVKTKYVTLTIEAENLPAARARFARIETDTLNRFKVMGAAAHVLDGKERLELLYNILHPEGGQFAFEWDWLPASGLSVKDFIAPSSFHFGETRTFRIGRRYGAVSFLQILAPEMHDRILTDFMEADGNIMVTMHIRGINQNEAIKMVKRMPEHLRNYIDYEAYGRDIALEESGQFTDLGYVRDTGDSFHEYYDGERGSIPEEYRVMTFQDDIPEDEISEWAMDLAYDMDEFFRQYDPQYAAEHPEEHTAKEEIYENLSDCRIASLEEKLKALGQTPEDYLPSELEKFKEAVGYEAYLDVDPQAIREAIENPDQSHVDEMLSFAEQANRKYEAELYGQQAAPTPDDRETGETVRTPRGTFHVTDMSREQMEAAGYGFHHESEDGKYLIMANGSRAFAIPNGDAPEHTAPEKLTVLVVEPMKEPYVKEIDPGLHALQAEVGGDIAASYPFDDPVGLVLNDEGKLIGLDLNRSLRDEHGEIYDIVAGTFLVVGLGPESFASLPPDMIQKYTEQFKRPELFANINGQIVSVPVEPENPLRTAEMTLEDDYGMIDGIINNGRRGEELEKAQAEARRTTPEKKPSIRERLEDAKRECGSRKTPDKPAPQKKLPELGDL